MVRWSSVRAALEHALRARPMRETDGVKSYLVVARTSTDSTGLIVTTLIGGMRRCWQRQENLGVMVTGRLDLTSRVWTIQRQPSEASHSEACLPGPSLYPRAP